MSEFNFELPKQHPDLPSTGLSEETRSALGTASILPELIPEDPIETKSFDMSVFKPEVKAFMGHLYNGEPDDWAPLAALRKYEKQLGMPPYMVVDDLAKSHPSFETKINSLFNSYVTLTGNSELLYRGKGTPSRLRLMVVPYGAFKDNLNNLGDFCSNELGIPMSISNKKFLDVLANKYVSYRDPVYGSNRQSLDEYLTQKIDEQGPYGLALTQDINTANILNIGKKKSFEYYQDLAQIFSDTRPGTHVNGMGIFEWLTMYLNQPDRYKDHMNSYLLANEFGIVSTSAVYASYDNRRKEVEFGFKTPDWKHKDINIIWTVT